MAVEGEGGGVRREEQTRIAQKLKKGLAVKGTVAAILALGRKNPSESHDR